MSNANQNNANSAQQQNRKEQIGAADVSASAFPAGFQAIATAYGDYTKKSFEDTKSFVEKLSGVKSDSVGRQVTKSLEPGQEFIGIVNGCQRF